MTLLIVRLDIVRRWDD